MVLKNIPLNDLQAQYRTIKSEVMGAIEDVLEHMHLFLARKCWHLSVHSRRIVNASMVLVSRMAQMRSPWLCEPVILVRAKK